MKEVLRYDKWYSHNHEDKYNKMRCKIYKAFYYGVYLDYMRADEGMKNRLKSIPVIRRLATECMDT